VRSMTTLKRTYDKKDEIPAEFAALYEETGEAKWVLKVEIEGLVPAKRVDDFRDTNVKLRTRLEAYHDKDFGNGEVTPERVEELMAKEQELEDGKLTKSSEVAKKVEERTKEMRDKFEKEKKALQDQLSDKTSKLQRALIESKAVESAIPFGLKKTAHEDLIDRVLKVFKIDENGEPVAYQDDGKTIRYGADDKPLSIKEYVKGLATDRAKHLFEENTGLHGDPTKTSGRSGDGTEANPWMKDTFNRTQQGEIVRKDPDKAERMAARAGVALRVGESTRAASHAGVA
jgi:hypothetical protein